MIWPRNRHASHVLCQHCGVAFQRPAELPLWVAAQFCPEPACQAARISVSQQFEARGEPGEEK